MIKTKLELPTEIYTYVFSGHEFKVKPISDKCREKLETILDEGGKVRLIPETKPTSIFVSFNATSMPVKVYSYNVVGVEMNLHMHLIGQHRDFERRLDKFIEDVISYKDNYTNLPENSIGKSVKYVNVINTYKY